MGTHSGTSIASVKTNCTFLAVIRYCMTALFFLSQLAAGGTENNWPKPQPSIVLCLKKSFRCPVSDFSVATHSPRLSRQLNSVKNPGRQHAENGRFSAKTREIEWTMWWIRPQHYVGIIALGRFYMKRQMRPQWFPFTSGFRWGGAGWGGVGWGALFSFF